MKVCTVCICLSLLLLTGSACAARRGTMLARDLDAIQVVVRTTYYTVDLLDPRTLSRAMWDQGLADRSGAVGSAARNYRWSFEATPGEGGCTIRSLRATGEVIVTLPRWSAPTGTSADRRLWWQTYSGSIAAHENTHVRIFEDHLREMVGTVEGISGADCEQARLRARAELDRGTNRMHERQAEFDRSDGSVMMAPPP